jgi:polysaccharide export outer membrane protein
VSVWKNVDVSKVVTVRPDGIITLPLTGDIKVSGRTAEQVRKEVKRRLEQYLESPEVSVTVADVRSYNLFILGEVKTPGKYQVRSHTTLLQAVALAGGFTTFANTNNIVVVRQSPRAGQQRIRVKYADLVKRGDIGLNPGDTIIVP